MKKNTTGFKNISAMMAALAGLSSLATPALKQDILNTPVLRQNKGVKRAHTARTSTASIKRAAIKKRNKAR
jgi:hypothetical protein